MRRKEEKGRGKKGGKKEYIKKNLQRIDIISFRLNKLLEDHPCLLCCFQPYTLLNERKKKEGERKRRSKKEEKKEGKIKKGEKEAILQST